MKNIAVLTATRAEYGLLAPVIKKLKLNKNFNTKILVTGMHLSPEFGLTYKEIEQDGINIDKKVEILLSSDTPASITKTMGLALINFADYFSDNKIDALLVLGDRYETFAVCCAAINERIPIFHLYGGEATFAILDETYRHCITKMSFLHFTSTEPYRNRVIQLGESPERVFNVGAVGVENALNMKLLDKKVLEQELNFSLDKDYAIVTFHPVTLEIQTSQQQTIELINALKFFKNMKFIITKANADAEGRIINELFKKFVAGNDNCILIDSLGSLKYLSAMKYASMVIGNSSSGIIETPSFKIPTINIGERQKGRIKAKSIIDCQPNSQDIISAIQKAKEMNSSGLLNEMLNPYGDGNSSSKIVDVISEFLLKENIDLKKSFYDLKGVE